MNSVVFREKIGSFLCRLFETAVYFCLWFNSIKRFHKGAREPAKKTNKRTSVFQGVFCLTLFAFCCFLVATRASLTLFLEAINLIACFEVTHFSKALYYLESELNFCYKYL
jgi:hypothetical protein